jgi:CheY-like chemotaxis protein
VWTRSPARLKSCRLSIRLKRVRQLRQLGEKSIYHPAGEVLPAHGALDLVSILTLFLCFCATAVVKLASRGIKLPHVSQLPQLAPGNSVIIHLGVTAARWISVSAILSPVVLVAEDSGDTRHMLRRALELKGYRVLEAKDGQEALELTRIYRPNLIIVDLNMPVLDGLETIKYVRLMKGNVDPIPIVAITAFDVYGMEQAAHEAGCNEYLSKPFDLDELDRKLRGLGFVP